MSANFKLDYLLPRQCMREPISELWAVADLLSEAATAHVKGDRDRATMLLSAADEPAVRAWTESLWGSVKQNPEQPWYRRVRKVEGAPPCLPRKDRVPLRMPTNAEKAKIIAHYGRHCVFCGVPLIRQPVRALFNRMYPEAVPWGKTNLGQHAAFQALWLQFDHLVPHSRGGDNRLENIVVTCAGCNFGRMENTIEELGLLDPRHRPRVGSDWDGLEHVMGRG